MSVSLVIGDANIRFPYYGQTLHDLVRGMSTEEAASRAVDMRLRTLANVADELAAARRPPAASEHRRHLSTPHLCDRRHRQELAAEGSEHKHIFDRRPGVQPGWSPIFASSYFGRRHTTLDSSRNFCMCSHRST
ncbi:hypothetical protein [Nannocystis sp.]|uniref:hypothetical protein n=1 Tax=Nannocystis sp. TaxID=1962667 RepID=UPI0025E70394|nr:hypothetical protein [Nannocystis sp.]MBK7829757.1 hypothetical protein [Nannocystis sp.]